MSDQLQTLHSLVATSLIEDLEAAENMQDPVERQTARHQARAQAITFLKNHSYIGKPDENAHLADLQRKLNERRQAGKRGLAALSEAADAFSAQIGGPVQ